MLTLLAASGMERGCAMRSRLMTRGRLLPRSRLGGCRTNGPHSPFTAAKVRAPAQRDSDLQ